MKLLLKQEHAIYYLKQPEIQEVLYGGAAGGGKSALGCLWLIENCQKYKGSRWLMGRAHLKTLEETTLNTFFEVSTKLGISNQYRYNAQKNIIYWNNGSQILLKDLFQKPSDKNFDSLGSLEITGAFIDECNQVAEKAWMVVKSRIRYKLTEFGLTPKIMGSCNPAKNWVYKEFYKPSKDGNLKPYRRFIQALPKDNPFLDPSYIPNLLQMDKNSIERLYYGNWEYDDDPTVLIELDAIADYFNPVHLIPINLGKTKYMTIDVARLGKDKTVFRIWEGWLCIHRESLDISPLPIIVERAKKLQGDYGISASNIIADEDGVGGGVVDYLRCKGFVNNSSPIEIVNAGSKEKQNFENLRSQCFYLMAKKIQKREAGEVVKDSDIKDTLGEEMEQVRIKSTDDGIKIGIVKKAEIKERIGRSPDDWDSVGMRYWFELKPSTKVRNSYVNA